jgi:hypothetical protein
VFIQDVGERIMKVKNSITEDIMDYFIQVGILKSQEEYSVGDNFFTDWYNKLKYKQKEKVWKDAGDAWWKAYGLKLFDGKYTEEIADNFKEGDIIKWWDKKIKDDLEIEKKEMMEKLRKYWLKVVKNPGGKNKHQALPKNKMRKVDSTILNNRGYKFGGAMEMKNKITEDILNETELQSTAPFSVESDDIYGGFIRIQYDNQSGTTTEGVEELIHVLQAELFGWQYVMKHEEFYWKDGAWENKYDKK